MKIENFEEIESWKEARNLARQIYTQFKGCKDSGFKEQIQRAAISIMSNVAEGFDRGSNRELVQFLIIARGSAAEVRSLSYAALDIGYLTKDQCNSNLDKCTKLSSLINGFIRYLNNTERKK